MKNSTAFILLILSVALFYSFVMPYYDKVNVLRDQSTKYKEILGNIVDLAQKRDDLEVKYANIPPEEVIRLEKVLPDNVDTVNLAMNLDSIAAKYGISINSIRAVEANDQAGFEIVQSTAGPYAPVSISFSFVASYQDFRNFIEDIEQSLRIIDIKNITFDTTETGLYEFSISADTYWLN